MKTTRDIIFCLILGFFWVFIIAINDTPPSLEPPPVSGQKKKIKKTEQDKIIKVKMIDIPKQLQCPKEKTLKKIKKKVAGKPSRGKNSGSDRGSCSGDKEFAVIATYHLPIRTYLGYMESKGAKIALYDRLAGDFACRVRPDGTFIGSVTLEGMSPRARMLTKGFPSGKLIIEKAHDLYGASNYEILLLMPHGLDERFHQSIRHCIQKSGINPKEVITVRVTYMSLSLNSDRKLLVRLDRLETQNASVRVDQDFTL
ncbi:MAG: hypothetical protein HOJ48_05000 [Desulfobacula sp.]|jgi:hypothetical protein|nr:hypothetical protein [Desulfobacula sp.]